MPGTRLAAVVAALALAWPGAAFAQGAGEDQAQDPFGEQLAQTQPGDGLTDEPPVPDGPDGGAPDRDGSGGAGGGGDGATSGGGRGGGARGELPNTGSEALWLAYAGVTFVLIGAGLRLRTIDPDAY